MIASVAVPAGGASAALLTPTTAWFASWSQGRLLAIDRKSLQVRTVRVGQPNNGPLSMTYGGGALWVVDFADAALLKLNPATGALLARRVLHDGGEVGAVAYANDFVWLGVSGLLGSGSAREHLLKLHPRTLATVATLDLPGEGEDLQLASSGTVLWVAGAMSPVAIDTLTGRAVMRLPDDGETAPVGGGVLWTAGAAGLRSRDADTGRRVTDVALNGSATVLAVGPRGEAWIAGPPLRMIQRTGRSYLLPQSGSVDATAVDNSTLWVHTARHVLVFDIAHLVR